MNEFSTELKFDRLFSRTTFFTGERDLWIRSYLKVIFPSENLYIFSSSQGMEKVKNRMNEEVEDLLLDLERAQSQVF